MTLFASTFTLRFCDIEMEKLYQSMLKNQITKYNWINVLFTLLLLIGVNILLIVYFNKDDERRLTITVSMCCAICLLFTTIISFILVLNKRNCVKLQKVIAYQMSITSYAAFSYYRYFIYEIFAVDNSIGYFIGTFEYIIRGTYVYFGILDFKETAIIAIVQVCCNVTYWSPLTAWWVNNSYNFAYYFVFLFITVVIIYYFSREGKKAFALKNQIQKNINWYESIMNNSNTGLMRISDNKVTLLNDKMIHYMRNNDKLGVFLEEIKAHERKASDETLDKKAKQFLTSINIKFWDFLHMLLILNNTDSMNVIQEETNIALTLESHEEREIKSIYDNTNILQILKRRYINLHLDIQEKKFYNFGNINLQIQTNKEIPNQDDGNVIHEPEIEIITLEILFCYYQDEETRYDNFDFIFNDVTQTTKKAEFKYKSLYFSKIAHEFKNPLITILGLSDKLKDDLDSKNKDATNSIDLIQAYSNYMLFLAKDIETFTNIQLKQNNCLSSNKTSISELIFFVTQLANCLIGRYNKSSTVKFLTKIDALVSNSSIIIDEIKLKQILINIISNSVKFTNEGFISLTISIDNDRKYIKFTVSDTGIGMNESTKKKLCCPFHKTNKNNPFGTGLGMCIVQELSKMLDGNLLYDSIENVGTTFWLDFPLVMATSDKQDIQIINSNEKTKELRIKKKQSTISFKQICPIKKDSVGIDNKCNESALSTTKTIHIENFNPIIGLNDPDNQKTLIELKNTYKPIRKETKKLTIIVADDEPLIRNSTIRVLQQVSRANGIPIQIYEASDGYEILYLLITRESGYQKYDLILCDENMVYCNGLKCQKEINNLTYQHKISQVPFFILSANYAYTSISTNRISKPLSNDIAEQLLYTIATEISFL